ncbi:MAG: PQQ-dependent sugar dehydrogenase [Bacteroidota bacterium]
MKKRYLFLLLLPVAALLAFYLIQEEPAHSFPEVIETEKLSFRLDTVAEGLGSVWGMAFFPNGDLLFTEKKGDLRIIQDGELHPDPIEGVPEVFTKGQAGLFDLELHPDYETNGWIYLSYASPQAGEEAGSGGNTTLMRAKLDGNQLTEQEVLFKALPNYNKGQHFGGRIEFDREGYLYLSIGDRGGRDENQTLTNYRGKVFRLYDDGKIPEDNPFSTQSGAVKEAFSYGHRNPQGLSLHPETGELWEHEHGPRGGDEVNIVRAGNNYGWPTITYGINYNGTTITEDTAMAGMEQPVTYWVPSIAPCGMDFVTSSKFGPWKSNLLVGSLKFRYIKRLEIVDNEVTHQEIMLENLGRIRVIREAPDGHIYVGTEGPGLIVRLMP